MRRTKQNKYTRGSQKLNLKCRQLRRKSKIESYFFSGEGHTPNKENAQQTGIIFKLYIKKGDLRNTIRSEHYNASFVHY